ncbi:MAG: ABC transporter substrate-binding protein [Spirochaetota bacterium]
MKKTAGIVTLVLAVSILSCKQQEKEADTYTIGISKIVAHPALDAVEQGIQDALAGEGIDATFDLQNANGDLNTASSIAKKFKAQNVDIAVGIATPTAQALVNTLKSTPVIYSAVTDPVKAGLVSSFDRGEENVTGVSDMTPVKDQLEFLMKVKKVGKLGHIYSSHEDNAVALAQIARKACAELGIEMIESTVTNSSEVKQAAQTIAPRVDAIYVSTDNTVVSALPAVVDVADQHNIPVMSADPSSAENIGVLAAWGFNYYKMGRATGRMVAEVLRGKPTSQIPTLFMTDAKDIDLLINLDKASELGLVFDTETIESAGTIVRDEEVSRK